MATSRRKKLFPQLVALLMSFGLPFLMCSPVASKLSKWRMDPQYDEVTLFPNNDKLIIEEQDIR